MKFTVIGVGPGDKDQITIKALKEIEKADLVLTPHSKTGKASVAEQVFRAHLPQISTHSIVFPMSGSEKERDDALLKQLTEMEPLWKDAKNIVLPVIGDSSLYATGAYLYDVWKTLVPDIELALVPGIPAYSLATSIISSFLVLGDEILTIIPANKEIDKLKEALKISNTVALYKPYILRDKLEEIITSTGKWKKIVRIDEAGLPNEKIYEGEAALKQATEYLSILLLWK
ncbi:MAG: precorrin-2 C(20)-methyltransferase [Synergistaceae bacterium]